MGKVSNINFFKQETHQPDKAQVSQVAQRSSVQIRRKMAFAIKKTADSLVQMGMQDLAKSVAAVYRDAACESFTVSVIGEFNRGKSSMINRMLGQSFLPEGNLPTTAILTRIMYGVNPMITFYAKNGTKVKDAELKPESWEGWVADNFGDKEPEGLAVVRLKNDFLGKYGIELIDCPGAGDLEEKRARQIGDALTRSDGVILTIDATQPMSMSEQLFVEQRILTRKNPFMMLALNKLDLTPLQERDKLIQFIYTKLSQWNLDIPVVIPNNIELPSEQYQDIVGVDKLFKVLISWVQNPQRAELTEQWLLSRVESILDIAENSLKQQVELLDADDSKRLMLIKEKEGKLSVFADRWNALRMELEKRLTLCMKQFVEKTEKEQGVMIERLQFEAGHTQNAQKWWKEDYPYRLKVELANLSAKLENYTSGIIANDARWFNQQLERQFKTFINIEKQTVTSEETMLELQSMGRKLDIKDLTGERNKFRIGTTALSIAGALALSATGFGFLSLIATLGVGSGASIMSETIFRKKIEQQREDLKAAIAKDVPRILMEATAESETRLKIIYNNIAQEASKTEKLWMEAQRKAIQKANQPTDGEQRAKIDKYLAETKQLRELLNS